MKAGTVSGRFVVLEHRWDGVHWDFMLETEGGLRTWAVDAPIEPGIDRPARALPDHRPAYLTYEGPISGGRGEVRRLDSGTYTVLEWSETRVRVLIHGAQLVGEVTLYSIDSGSSTSVPWKFRLGKVI
jgi:hypothetical protein